MNEPEKTTYLVFRHGKPPEKFRLGNLVIFPRNPEDDDPYVCHYALSKLQEDGWISEVQKEENLTIEVQDSVDEQVSANMSNFVKGNMGKSDGSRLVIEGKKARRFEIDQPVRFLNEALLSSPQAKDWLSSRLVIARHQYYLNQLKWRSSKQPHIWMVTGLQLLSDVTIRSELCRTVKGNLDVHVPNPDLASIVASLLLADDHLVGASASILKGRETKVGYHHTEERVWAAQFRRLKVDFMKSGTPQPTAIPLHKLVNLGHLGFRGSGLKDEDQPGRITGLDNDSLNDGEEKMTENDRSLFGKLKKGSASGKRALLIGGSEHRLRGVRGDLRAMSGLLIDRGFDVSLCYGEMATRAGILDAWNQLIQQTREGDTIVIYYSGHGGSSESSTSAEEFRIQYIIPIDIDQTTMDDFRGILDVELSYLITLITDKTHNVTIVLDCCHSERAARMEEPGVRAWSPTSREEIDAHVRRLRGSGFLNRPMHIEGNPYSVRIAAAESDAPAFESDAFEESGSKDEDVMGNLTRELVAELKKIGRNVASWDMVLSQLRLKLENKKKRSQRPQIEGPSMRSLFSLDRLDYFGQLGVKVDNVGDASLMGGSLVGVREADEYAIMPSIVHWIDLTKLIAIAHVDSTTPASADISLKYTRGYSQVPDGARAFPFQCFRPAYGVQVKVDDEALAQRLRSRLGSARFIYDFDSKRNGKASVPFATIKQGNGNIVLLHSNDDPVFEYPIPTAAEYRNATDDIIHQLQKLARANQLLTLTPAEDEVLDASKISIECGYVKRGIGKPFLDGAAHVFEEGQAAYLKICNGGNTSVFASVFLVTSIGTIEWLSEGSPSGHEVHPKIEEPYIPGQESYGTRKSKKIHGFEFEWPSKIPRRGSLKEAFVVILTSGRVDLGVLGTQYRVKRSDSAPGREWRRKNIEDDDSLCFSIHRIDFSLVPKRGAETPR